MTALLTIKDLKVYYPIKTGILNRTTDHIKAVDGVDLVIEAGKTYGIIGESGSGKSTIGKTIVGLEQATSGEIIYEGVNILHKKTKKRFEYNKDVQMIFQDSLSSLNPKKRIKDIISEPLKNFEKLKGEELQARVREIIKIVGLDEDSLYKYPHQFSGGQRQRIDIARAVATRPKLIIADEPVSALDLSVQAQVLNYLKRIQKKYGIAYLFISHDLGVVYHMCDTLAIMHRGRFVEVGGRKDIYQDPRHIYTKRLLAAIPQTTIADREINKQRRQKLEQEFLAQKIQGYDESGKPYPLQRISETHLVALRKGERSNVEDDH
ncbi:ATP-binding cassette domain-containing protein [Ligilactobacillus faecis]|uniref:ATP-binding cassette domain-containing protein n=1 Tax=Ligilactobacillus faecis TaxID=762833 RepID=A0ABV4DRB5_9LACO